MYRIGALVGMVTTLLISEAVFADFVVACQKKRGNATTHAVTYQIKSTESRRLASDILLTIDSSTFLASTSSIAQYLSKPNILFFMVDDPSENRILEFKGYPHHKWRGKFEGVLSEIASGQVVTRTRLSCTMNAI